jgi:MFS family permease
MAAGPTFMSEICPHDIRGRMLSFWQMFYSVGALVCTYIALGTSYCKYFTLVVYSVIEPGLYLICFVCGSQQPWYVAMGYSCDCSMSCSHRLLLCYFHLPWVSKMAHPEGSCGRRQKCSPPYPWTFWSRVWIARCKCSEKYKHVISRCNQSSAKHLLTI